MCLRSQAGDLSDRGLSDLIGELVTRSDGFAARWPGTTCGCIAPPANGWATGGGEIELTGDALDLAGDGLTLIAYSAELAARLRTS